MKLAIMVALAVAAVLVTAPVLADRVIFAPTGTVLGGGDIRVEAAVGSGDNLDKVYWAGIGLQRLEVSAFRLENSDWLHHLLPGGLSTRAASRFDLGSELVGKESLDVVNAELAVLPETTLTPGIGLGVWDISDQTRDGRGFFVAASKVLPATKEVPLPIHDIRVHVGAGIQGIEGLFAGAEASLPLGLKVYAEYFQNELNVAVGWKVLPAVQLKGYLLDGEPFVGLQISSPL